jgi:hypothetical protein
MEMAVILFVYRRPQLTARVLERIAQVRPSRLLVVADGPKPGEEVACHETRRLFDHLDWDCELLTEFSEIPMGLRSRVSSGLKWAFEHVEEAVVLEDDSVAHPSFFTFCQELLARYRDDHRIFAISGHNYQRGQSRGHYSYFFTRYFHCGGWATWKRSVDRFHPDMEFWPQVQRDRCLTQIFESRTECLFWENVFDRVHRDDLDSWASVWFLTSLLERGLTITPQENLISDIGYGRGATHTIAYDPRYADLPAPGIQIPLDYPPQVVRHREADRFTSLHHFGFYPWPFHLLRKILDRLILLLGRES